MAERARQTTEPDYLALDAASEEKLEYYGGVVVAMAGASPRHNVLTANIIGALRALLSGTPCLVLASDQRVRIASTGAYVYPDATVVRAEPRFIGPRPASLENPLFVVEVLSPSTKDHDHGVKLAHYRRLPPCTRSCSSTPRRITWSSITASKRGSGSSPTSWTVRWSSRASDGGSPSR